MLNTNTIYNEAGTGAPDFPAGMPTVGGDPVVESGSNSDGEWTRWADGTQECQHITAVVTTATNLSGTADIYRTPYIPVNFPVAFSSPPRMVPFSYENTQNLSWGASDITPSLTDGGVYGLSCFNNVTTRPGYIAIGRYK